MKTHLNHREQRGKHSLFFRQRIDAERADGNGYFEASFLCVLCGSFRIRKGD
jgi:hypothetical protein